MTRGKRALKIVIADAQKLFRRGLATLIGGEADLELAGEATSAAEAVSLIEEKSAVQTDEMPAIDVLVMDIELVKDDPETVKMLRRLNPPTAILFLTKEESADSLELTMAAGARAYMLKTASPAQLMGGIRQAALSGDRSLSPQAPDLKALAQSERAFSRSSPLTTREQEVMVLLAEGRTVREVALELSLSIKTIEAHKLNLMRKLDIHNRASLVDYAVRSGLLPVQAENSQ